uniref:ACB domain-containing protein n=1 Tax=Kalanchoe fedtschenkoi TaxID=63787 RepID=A0A7N0TR66_KALFE
MDMVTELVLTALAAALLSFLVAKLVSAAVGGREAVEGVVVEERRMEGGGRRSGKKVRFAGVQDGCGAVVDRFEGVEDDERAVVETAAVVGEGVEVEGFGRLECVGNSVEEIGEVAAACVDGRELEEVSAVGDEDERGGEVAGLVEGSPERSVQMESRGSVEVRVDEARVEPEDLSGHCGGEQNEDVDVNKEVETEEVACEGFGGTGDEPLADVVRSACDSVEGFRSLKPDDIGGDVGGVEEEEKERGSGSVSVDETGDRFGAENVVSGHPNELAFCARVDHIDEIEEEENRELQAMHVENSDIGEEGKNEELKDALAEPVEEYLRNIEGGVKEEDGEDGQMEGDLKEKEKGEKEELKDAKVEISDELTEDRLGSSDEDDWEGIEMSELDNDFSAAAAFVRIENNGGKLSSIGSEVKLQLYALQKIITEGPCREPQPMALKMSARAKWNAWQRLGNMNPEEAMKQYISVVSDLVPEWAEQNAGVDYQSAGLEAINLSFSDPDQPKPLNESQSKTELVYDTEGGGTTASSSIEFKDNK